MNLTKKVNEYRFPCFRIGNIPKIKLLNRYQTQLTFNCSKSTTETLENVVLVFLLLTLNIFLNIFYSVSIVDFEQVKVSC